MIFSVIVPSLKQSRILKEILNLSSDIISVMLINYLIIGSIVVSLDYLENG